jgi:hypothetical protein
MIDACFQFVSDYQMTSFMIAVTKTTIGDAGLYFSSTGTVYYFVKGVEIHDVAYRYWQPCLANTNKTITSLIDGHSIKRVITVLAFEIEILVKIHLIRGVGVLMRFGHSILAQGGPRGIKQSRNIDFFDLQVIPK